METPSMDNDNDATFEETVELLKETARIFYQNTEDRVTINLYFAVAGVLLAIAALYFLWNFLPAALSSLVSTVSQVATGGGGYGRPHLSRYGNKYSSGALASYDEYDDYNYSAAGEHFEAKEELADLIRRSDTENRRSDLSTGASFYSGSFTKPGGHLVQRQIY